MLLTLTLITIGFMVLLIGIQQVREIYYANRCLDEETLRKFQYNRIHDQKTYDHIVTHLSTCVHCQELLRAIQTGKPIEDHLIHKEDETI